MFDPERIRRHVFQPIEQRYEPRDAILYALGLGLGADPLDADDLDHLLEDRLRVLPAFAGTLASPGPWIRDPAFGVTFEKLLHLAQAMEVHASLPRAATVRATPRVTGVFDRGAGRGAIVVVEREVYDTAADTLLATVRQTVLLRADGGFGGPPPPVERWTAPTREPDIVASVPVSRRAALIYRLSGDRNPLHVDPAAARAGGFPAPILHGLASYGIAARAVERACGRAPARLAMRFSGVVFPGDRLDLSMWRDGDGCAFQAHVDGRPVLDRGEAGFRDRPF